MNIIVFDIRNSHLRINEEKFDNEKVNENIIMEEIDDDFEEIHKDQCGIAPKQSFNKVKVIKPQFDFLDENFHK